MTVAFAAIHERLRYRDEDTGLHVLSFIDGTTFFSRRQPKLYDAGARAEAVEGPGRHLGDELGREAVQAVGAGGGRRREICFQCCLHSYLISSSTI